MTFINDNEVERRYVIRPDGWDQNRRWKTELPMEEGITTYDPEEDAEEYFDFQRAFSDDYGFTVYALCAYTNEYEFSHGEFIYAWEVYLGSEESEGCYYCENFAFWARDDEAERYEIFRIADAYVGHVSALIKAKAAAKCPHAGEEYHDEISYFVNGFLNDVFGQEE